MLHDSHYGLAYDEYNPWERVQKIVLEYELLIESDPPPPLLSIGIAVTMDNADYRAGRNHSSSLKKKRFILRFWNQAIIPSFTSLLFN